MGEYGATGTADIKAEYIWLMLEVGATGPTGGDDGLGGYMPLATAVGQTGTLNWLHTHHHGAPILTTNAAGTIVPYPAHAVLGFPGQFANSQQLAGAQHYYNRYRDYDVNTGRYIQTDPIGLAGDDNPYAYAGGNPLRYVDPLGLKLRCVGTKSFCEAVAKALAKIESKKQGAAQISKLRQSEFDNIITQAMPRHGVRPQCTLVGGENSVNQAQVSPGDAYGRPSAAIAEWSPTKTSGGTDTNGSNQRPPYIGLVHELGHVRAFNLGVQAFSNPLDPRIGSPGYTPPSELYSVANENAVRREQGLPLRNGY